MCSVAEGGAEGVFGRDRKEQRESAPGRLGGTVFWRREQLAKGSEAGEGVVCLRDSEEARVAGAVWAKWEKVRIGR